MDCTDRENRGKYDEPKKKIISYIRDNLSEKRLKHTYAVADEAVNLAKRYGVDPQKAEISALAHDMFRGASKEILNEYVKSFNLEEKYIDNLNLAHGKIASKFIEKEYGIRDADILNAVAYHTTGRAGMSELEKVLFLADAIEPNRNFPTVDETRRIARKSLDKACINALKRAIAYLKESGVCIDDDTMYALEDLQKKEKTTQ